jgi:hypothetical protein
MPGRATWPGAHMSARPELEDELLEELELLDELDAPAIWLFPTQPTKLNTAAAKVALKKMGFINIPCG